ncbi:hypothetical protein HK104_010343, partial [Borealophlyctis nickersoniae]
MFAKHTPTLLLLLLVAIFSTLTHALPAEITDDGNAQAAVQLAEQAKQASKDVANVVSAFIRAATVSGVTNIDDKLEEVSKALVPLRVQLNE